MASPRSPLLAGEQPASAGTGLLTEYPFVLPRGYVDEAGVLHRDGVMRLATARDEITTQTDPRVHRNPAYLTVLLLARTIVRLGTVQNIDPILIENLFASDLAFLQDLYRRINQEGHTEAEVTCPACGQEFTVDVAGDALGEALCTRSNDSGRRPSISPTTCTGRSETSSTSSTPPGPVSSRRSAGSTPRSRPAPCPH
jgi:hypothetical protein